jgi:HSP20 family protein
MLPRVSFLDDMLSEFLGYSPMDVREDDKGFEIDVDLPGVDPGDIDIQVKDGSMSIKAERKWAKTGAKASFRRSFSETFALPANVDSDAISATYAHGVLKVAVPRRTGPSGRRVEVKA